MKKPLFLSLLVLITGSSVAQNADSLSTEKLVDSLIQISQSFTSKNNFDKALEAIALAEKLVLENSGRETAAYGRICFNHGRILYFKRDYPESEKWYLESITTRARVLGKAHVDYAQSLSYLADLYAALSENEKAESLYLEAKSIREKVLGKEHPDYATTLNDLAVLYKQMGNYEQAERLYFEAISIREKVLGKEHSDYATSLNNLANLYREMGNYEQAERLLLQTRSIKEKVLGKEHPDYARSLNNLAELYREMGNFKDAEPLYLESRDIRAKVLGKEHPDYATSLNTLAICYKQMGNYKKAEPLYLEAKDIRVKTLGKEHPFYANVLNNLANLYLATGDYDKAKPLYLEAIDIRAKVLGKEHPDYAWSLNNLADLYFVMGDYNKAESLYLEAKDIRAKSLGKENHNYATSLNNLAKVYLRMGAYEKAESLYLEAKDIRAKVLGKEHPSYGSTLAGMSLLYQKTKRIPETAAVLLELSKLNRRLVERSASFSSENQMLAYLKTFDASLAQFNSFVQSNPTPELCQESYTNALFFNSLTLENNQLLARAIAGSDSLTRQLYLKWESCRQRLAKRYARPIAERKKIAEVEVEAETYEKMLMQHLPAFQEARKLPNWQSVREKLKPDEAAIEFLHYRYYSPEVTDSVQYAALILRHDWKAPKMIPLFEEKQLDSLLETNKEQIADYVANLYSISDHGIIAVEKPAKSLFDLIWKPLEPVLKASSGPVEKVNTIFFSPTGLLHRLNLAAIPVSSDSTLSDRYQLIELGSTRSLAVDTKAGQWVAQTETAFYNNNAILFGGIRFDMDSTAIFAANAKLTNTAVASHGPFRETNTDSPMRGGSWNFLKWTEKEVNALVPILSSGGISPEIRKGFEATEEGFKSIGVNGPSPRILHLATHGYFFPDLKDTSYQRKTLEIQETGFITSENPLIRSGLLLAGANYAWKTGKPLKKGMENGILTAYEISHMNLSNTELVVLSACETGLGDIQGNEGVYGLQRAFKIAGAKYLIMSLWQVPDFQTQELMTTFYTHWLTEKMSLPKAFHIAQQEMREKYQNPYFWAGFVLME